MLFKNKWVHVLCKHFTYSVFFMKEHSAKISIVCFNIGTVIVLAHIYGLVLKLNFLIQNGIMTLNVNFSKTTKNKN